MLLLQWISRHYGRKTLDTSAMQQKLSNQPMCTSALSYSKFHANSEWNEMLSTSSNWCDNLSQFLVWQQNPDMADKTGAHNIASDSPQMMLFNSITSPTVNSRCLISLFNILFFQLWGQSILPYYILSLVMLRYQAFSSPASVLYFWSLSVFDLPFLARRECRLGHVWRCADWKHRSSLNRVVFGAPSLDGCRPQTWSVWSDWPTLSRRPLFARPCCRCLGND